MFDAVEGKYKVFAYRICSPEYRPDEWSFALDQSEIEEALLAMQKDGGQWEAESIHLSIFDSQMRKFTAHIMGSKTSMAKKKASRENGRKGGRPRKNNPDS